MASAQVLSNSVSSSRKQGHLEAGKRRLEEFRKKKAEGRARKPALSDQQQPTDVGQYATEAPESTSKRPVDSDGATASERDEPPGIVATSDNKPINVTELGSSSGPSAISRLSSGNNNTIYSNSGQSFVQNLASKQYQGSELNLDYDSQQGDTTITPGVYNETQDKQTIKRDQSIPLNSFNGKEYNDGNVYQSWHRSASERQLQEEESHLKEDSGTSHASLASVSSEKHSDALQRDTGSLNTSASGRATSSLNEGYSADYISSMTSLSEPFTKPEQSNGSMVFAAGQRKFSSINQEPSTDSAWWKPQSSGSSFDFRSSSNHIAPNPSVSETGTRQKRSPFLDSLNDRRASPFSQSPFNQSEKSETFLSRSSQIQSADTLVTSASGQPPTSTATTGSFDKLRSPNALNAYDHGNNSVSVSTGDEVRSKGFMDSVMGWNHEAPTVKQDENFGALEQHIEDLTQEKFSLKRDLEASRALAESLAAENSSLTDSYNQQRAFVNQLKTEMESLQEEIKAHLLEVDAVKMEYSNAQLECNAADERAKILASEVIGLEEKALQLRSRELKLERELEKSNAEIASYKKKVSSLQKERQDLQFTIDALQEEKKLLQSKLRKAAGSVKSVEVVKAPLAVKNMSTSTEDLDFEVPDLARDVSGFVDAMQNTSNGEMQTGASVSSGANSAFQLPENRLLNFPGASAAIPPDQLRMIGNINSLISELTLEKEELMRALSSESSHSSKLKELNRELSRKLEAQTQRLELLTAQNMAANENTLGRSADYRSVNESIAYTDEGDEVVERVLGWIMKLFPGGPSKRRPKRLI